VTRVRHRRYSPQRSNASAGLNTEDLMRARWLIPLLLTCGCNSAVGPGEESPIAITPQLGLPFDLRARGSRTQVYRTRRGFALSRRAGQVYLAGKRSHSCRDLWPRRGCAGRHAAHHARSEVRRHRQPAARVHSPFAGSRGRQVDPTRAVRGHLRAERASLTTRQRRSQSVS